MFKKSHIYFQVRSGSITATHTESGQSITDHCAGLSHPRSLMGNFLVVESCMKELVSKLLPRSFLSVAPLGVVQLMEKSEGGYTDVEIRAFQEAALGAGCRQVLFVDSATPLSNQDVIDRNFNELE